MTKLSVNINKVATLRNSRGGDMPNVVKSAVDVQLFGADGVTVHPRPDERHITYQDVMDIKPIIKTEFNIEGYPSRNFIDLVKKVKPHQVTLVPDPPEAITSNAGWDTIKNKSFLQEIISEFSEYGIRTSIFIDSDIDNISNAAATGTDRVELYTEPYAAMFAKDRETAIAPFVAAAEMAKKVGLKINAGHDLSLENLKFFSERIPFLAEVSIGHALICDALYIGLERAVQLYKEQLKR